MELDSLTKRFKISSYFKLLECSIYTNETFVPNIKILKFCKMNKKKCLPSLQVCLRISQFACVCCFFYQSRRSIFVFFFYTSIHKQYFSKQFELTSFLATKRFHTCRIFFFFFQKHFMFYMCVYTNNMQHWFFFYPLNILLQKTNTIASY